MYLNLLCGSFWKTAGQTLFTTHATCTKTNATFGQVPAKTTLSLLELNCHFSKEKMLFGNSNYIVSRDKHQEKVMGQVHEWVTFLWSFYHKRLKNSFIPWQKAQKCSSTSNPETLWWLTCVQPSINSDAQGKQQRHQTGHKLAKWMQQGSITWTQAIAPFADLLGTSLSASLLTSHKISPLLAEVCPTGEHYW